MFIDAPNTIYTVFARNGVIVSFPNPLLVHYKQLQCLSISALVSLLAILFLLIVRALLTFSSLT